MKTDWRENRVVKRIYELRENYEFRHLFAGTTYWGDDTNPMKHMSECSCCGTLSRTLESLYHKTDNNKSIGICPTCSDLWRAVPVEPYERIIRLTRSDLCREDKDVPFNEVSIGNIKNDSMTRKELGKAEEVIFLDDDGQTKKLKSRD
jgi:hypothetical protein